MTLVYNHRQYGPTTTNDVAAKQAMPYVALNQYKTT